jgi:hypothetical protein
MVAPPLLVAAVGRGEDGIHLRLIHIRELVPRESLERNSSYLAAPCDMLRAAFGDEARRHVNGCETLVACAVGASSVLFEMIEEASQSLTRKVGGIESIHRLLPLSSGIGHQQPERVAIASLRVAVKVAFLDQMVEEKTLDPWAYQSGLRHEAPLV